MQMTFDFGAAADLGDLMDRLKGAFGQPQLVHRRTPIGQFVKSMISSRTLDAVSLAAYDRLVAAYPLWTDLANAAPSDIEGVIDTVKFPDLKARQLGLALRCIAADRPDFDLDFLACWPVSNGLSWLERPEGVGRKISASTLNFSTLRRPAFVVDTHVLRVLRRFGFVRLTADTRAAYHAVMTAALCWSADDLGDLHALLKRLGQTFCAAKGAQCAACPIRQGCKTATRDG
jgi:endonuclease-3